MVLSKRVSMMALVFTMGVCMATLPADAEDARNPHQKSAERLRDQVEDRLARSASLAGAGVDVNVEGGTVTLSGAVGNEGEKERAARLARRVRGVEKVQNELRVDAKSRSKRRAEKMSDEELARSIATSLASDTFPDAKADEEWLFGWEVEGDDWEFDVDVDGGNVTLEGSVDRFADIAKARAATRRMPGVNSVSADLWVAHDLYRSYSDRYYPYYPYYP